MFIGLKNNKGSVLIWAIVIILIFSVFAAAALTISYSMVQRSYDNNTNRQLFLTARSGSLTVANEIVSTNGTTLVNELIKNNDNELKIENLFSTGDNMGNCQIKAKYVSTKVQIIVTAVATQNNQTQIFSTIITKDANSRWVISAYDGKDIDSSR